MAPSSGREGKTVPDGRDWTVQAADAIEAVVSAVRDKTTVPLTTVARAVVFGLLAALLGTAVVVLLTIGLVRAVDVSLPGEVWSAYLAVGGIFTLGGGLLLRKAFGGTIHRAVREGDTGR